MRAKSKILVGVLSAILILSLAAPEAVQAQGRQARHTVSVRVPSVVRIIPDPGAVGPTGIPVFRVVTNDPAIRRRLEERSEGGLIAESLAADVGPEGRSAADLRFTVVAP